MRKHRAAIVALFTLMLGLAGNASGQQTYTATLTELNDSGVSGQATFILSADLTTLTVTITASGLEPDVIHPQHIHGLLGAQKSVLPDLSYDQDGDGYIEALEAEEALGNPLLGLTSPPGGDPADYPLASPTGTITFSEVYDLTDPATFLPGASALDLFPLDFRAVVLHGMSVPDGAGAGTAHEVYGPGGYKAVLPVAAGLIVPEPASLLLLGLAAGLLKRRS